MCCAGTYRSLETLIILVPMPRFAIHARFMSRRISAVVPGVMLLLAGVTASACAPSDRPDILARVRADGVLRVGYAQEAPYAFSTDDGDVTGLAPELLRRVAAAAGIAEVRFILVEFDRLLPGLEAQLFDVVGAGLFITPERAQRARFTSAIASAEPALLVRADDPALAIGPSAFRSAVMQQRGARLGVVAGAVEGADAQRLGYADSAVVAFPDVSSAVAALESGEITAFALSEPSVRWLESLRVGRVRALRDPDAEVTERTGRPAFATRHADSSLHAALDQALAAVCATGACDSLRQRFGFTTPTP